MPLPTLGARSAITTGHAADKAENGGGNRGSSPPTAASIAAGWAVAGARRRLQRRVLSEHRVVQLAQRGAGLHPQLVDEHPAGLAVQRQRLGLAPTAVQGEHPRGAQALAQRMLGRERLELGDQRGVTAEREVGVDADLQRLQAQLLRAARSRPRRKRRR